jgi:hypothetical protein
MNEHDLIAALLGAAVSGVALVGHKLWKKIRGKK